MAKNDIDSCYIFVHYEINFRNPNCQDDIWTSLFLIICSLVSLLIKLTLSIAFLVRVSLSAQENHRATEMLS